MEATRMIHSLNQWQDQHQLISDPHLCAHDIGHFNTGHIFAAPRATRWSTGVLRNDCDMQPTGLTKSGWQLNVLENVNLALDKFSLHD